jgi:hypothetical protein
MATVTELHAHITWDSEPTEEAKNFVRVEVLKVLRENFHENTSWFIELVRAEVRQALQDEARAMHKRIGRA